MELSKRKTQKQQSRTPLIPCVGGKKLKQKVPALKDLRYDSQVSWIIKWSDA